MSQRRARVKKIPLGNIPMDMGLLPKNLTDRVIPSGTSVARTRGWDRREAHMWRASWLLELTCAEGYAMTQAHRPEAKGGAGCLEFGEQGETEKKMRKQKTCWHMDLKCFIPFFSVMKPNTELGWSCFPQSNKKWNCPIF